MIPTSILILIFSFVAIYLIGLLLTVFLLIESIQDRHRKTTMIAIAILILYLAFGFGLL